MSRAYQGHPSGRGEKRLRKTKRSLERPLKIVETDPGNTEEKSGRKMPRHLGIGRRPSLELSNLSNQCRGVEPEGWRTTERIVLWRGKMTDEGNTERRYKDTAEREQILNTKPFVREKTTEAIPLSLSSEGQSSSTRLCF